MQWHVREYLSTCERSQSGFSCRDCGHFSGTLRTKPSIDCRCKARDTIGRTVEFPIPILVIDAYVGGNV